MSGHTLGPLWISGKGTVRTGKNDWIASVNWRNREANAARIVACVNAFPDDIPTEAIEPGVVGELIGLSSKLLGLLRGGSGLIAEPDWLAALADASTELHLCLAKLKARP